MSGSNLQVTVSSGQVARLLDVSSSTVRRLAACGELQPHARTPHGHARFLLADVQTYITEKNKPPDSRRPQGVSPVPDFWAEAKQEVENA